MTDPCLHQESRRAERVDDLFDALGDARRRALLRCLGDAPTPASLSAVATDLRERRPPDERPDETRLRTALLHAHVPKLDDADVVDFDRDERLLAEGRRWSAAEELLAAERSVVDGAPGST